MCKIEGKMAQALYLSILQDGSWRQLNVNVSTFLMSYFSYDPKYTAKLVKQWLSMNFFDVLTWPPQARGLNPMEHEWALMNRKLNEYPTPTKGMLWLWECVQASFHSITLEQCQKFYHSMPNRIQVVLASKEGWTNYWSIGWCRLQSHVNVFSSLQIIVSPCLVLQ